MSLARAAQRLALVPFLLLPALPVQAQAQTQVDGVFMLHLAAMNHLDNTLALEKQFHALVANNDSNGIATLAAEIEGQHGPFLAHIDQRSEVYFDPEAISKVDQADPDMQILINYVGPCEQAGMLVRHIITKTAEGTYAPVMRADAVMIDGTHIDQHFSGMAERCERVSQRPVTKQRLIGNRCMTTGIGCLDDPDLGKGF